ncbi:MAG: sensor histidine kinase [Opitutae bacterium]|nr:sensor histidine kinase [Opitutae bacterium]
MSPAPSSFRRTRLLPATVGLGLLLVAIFAGLLVRFRSELHEEIRRTVIGRDAAVLLPVARNQITGAEARTGAAALRTEQLLAAVLPSAQQDGMLAVAVFDAQGNLARAVPGTLLFAELAAPDYLALLAGNPISRFHTDFPLDRYFTGTRPGATAPVLEVLLPLEGRARGQPLGFVQYYLDARALGGELALIEQRLNRQTLATLGAGTLLIALVLSGAYLGVARAQRLVAERNERLARANFELTLAAKASALGQITSHLIHGLQGSVAGLRAAVSAGAPARADWASAAHYTERMQSLITEVVGLLGDARTGATYELSGGDLAAIIRDRGAAAAETKGVELVVASRLERALDSHRGSLLCLIAANLVHNAVAATAPGRRVSVELAEESAGIRLVVADEGTGIDEALRPRLFEPGVSGRAGGTGLGLAISRLLVRQINGELELLATGPQGTVFCASVPLPA